MGKNGRIARRLWLPLVVATALLVAGCGQTSVSQNGPEPTSVDTATIAVEPTTALAPRTSSTKIPGTVSGPTSSTSPTVLSGQTFEAVILGPAGEPLAPADIAPQIFRDEASVREVLRTSLPAGVAAQQGQYVFQGTHLIQVLSVAGATKSETGIEVYADVWEQWFALAGWQPVQDTGGIYPARIRLKKEGDVLRLDGVDKPKDGEGYIPSLNEMLPSWVRNRVDRQETRAEMEEALLVAAADWARPNVPADLFVDQAAATIPDPHEHQPPSSQYRMLGARYVDCELVKIASPSSDVYQPEFACASEDGRFRLFFLLTGGVAVEDTRTGGWQSIVAFGRPMMAVAPTASDPVWGDHTLFIDFVTTIIDPLRPTLTHYEIDFDAVTVVRAVSMGPLSFNEPAM